jgi:putative ABC transport system permease protein
MGMDDPVGKHFDRSGGFKSSIVGVTRNFNFENLKAGIEPMVIMPLLDNPNNIIIRVQANNFYATVNKIKEQWASLFPQTPCELGFFDEQLKDMYNSELRISGLFRSFTFIAIFIACIGLFGLSLYAIELRRKEIGIRKVNGSTSFEILTLLNKDFVALVVISFIIACPVAYYAMNKWLENFAYKTQPNWWVFVFAGLLALAIALITVSWQSYKAARQNPVESLKYE